MRPLYDMENDNKPPRWDAVYIDRNDLMEEGIIISREALEHHHLWSTLNAIEESIRGYDDDQASSSGHALNHV